jgi:hypothetical protein
MVYLGYTIIQNPLVFPTKIAFIYSKKRAYDIKVSVVQSSRLIKSLYRNPHNFGIADPFF